MARANDRGQALVKLQRYGATGYQGGEALPNVNYFSCVETPFGLLTAYHVMAFIFGLIALFGLVWPLAQRVLMRSRSQVA